MWRAMCRRRRGWLVTNLGGEIMMRTIPLLAGTLALVTGVLTAEVNAAEVKVLSAGVMRGVLQELAPAFETASGHKLKIDYATAGVVEQKVAADDEIDVAILTKPRVDKLVREAKIVGGTTKTLVVSYYLPDLKAAGLGKVWDALDVVARIITQDGN